MKSTKNILPLRLNRVGLTLAESEVLRDIDFTLNAGGITILLGANGSGKSLLMQICHGYRKPDKGSVSWQSDPWSGAQPQQTLMGQMPVMLNRSALANVAFALGSLPVNQRNGHAFAALEWAGIETLANQQANRLSVGQQQLIALARAKAMDTELLLLDEPAASLDPLTARRVESLIAKLAEQGKTILMSTHNLGQAKRLANRILFLADGSLIEDNSAAEFFSNPNSSNAREFLATERGDAL